MHMQLLKGIGIMSHHHSSSSLFLVHWRHTMKATLRGMLIMKDRHRQQQVPYHYPNKKQSLTLIDEFCCLTIHINNAYESLRFRFTNYFSRIWSRSKKISINNPFKWSGKSRSRPVLRASSIIPGKTIANQRGNGFWCPTRRFSAFARIKANPETRYHDKELHVKRAIGEQ